MPRRYKFALHQRVIVKDIGLKVARGKTGVIYKITPGLPFPYGVKMDDPGPDFPVYLDFRASELERDISEEVFNKLKQDVYGNS